QALGMMVVQKRLQHLAVWRETVGPEIVAHQVARGLELLVDERQRAFAGRGIFELLQALRLRLLEGLEHGGGKPWILLHQRSANAGEVHDRKNASAPVVVAPGRDRVGPQPANIRIVLSNKPRHARGDEGVDLAGLQKLRDRPALGRVLEPYVA